MDSSVQTAHFFVPILLLVSLLLSVSFSCNNRQGSAESHMYLFPGQMTKLNISHFQYSNFNIEVSFAQSNTARYAIRLDPDSVPSIAVYEKETTEMVMCLRNKINRTVHHWNVTLYYCPPGFNFTPHGTCECPLKNINPNLICNQQGFFSGVLVGNCVSRMSGNKKLYIARCAVAKHLIKPLLPIPQDNVTGQINFCRKFNRKGKLCSECKNGSALSVFSDTFDCIHCPKFEPQNFILYLVIELVPTTVFVLLILFFHIGITSGPVSGYIFFAQMITTPLEILFLTYGLSMYVEDNSYLAKIMSQLIVNPYCIWNLTFFRIFNTDLCLHPSLRVVHILALRLVLALYPLLLVLVTYVIIELKARNIRIVTWLWWLICLNCIRWRRVWQARTSVIDAFASCVLLSYTKFVLVSLLYLSPSHVYDSNGKFIEKVLSFDTSLQFMSRAHKPYVIVAIVSLLTFGAVPPLILTFYQFTPFQNVLKHLRLRGVGMQRFVEAFQGCYKDGTEGNTDCRFFAGLYFLLRFIVAVTMGVSPSFPIGFTCIIVTLAVFLLLLAVFQPYKNRLYNIVDSAMIFIFIAVTTLQVYIYNYLQETLKISRLFLLYYALLYIPLIYIIVYVVNWLYRQWKHRHNRRLYTPLEQQTDFFRESTLAEHREPMPVKHTSVEYAAAKNSSYSGSFPSQKRPTCSEVTVADLSEDEDDQIEGMVRERSLSREQEAKNKNSEENEREGGREAAKHELKDKTEFSFVKEKPQKLMHRELMHYGSIN